MLHVFIFELFVYNFAMNTVQLVLLLVFGWLFILPGRLRFTVARAYAALVAAIVLRTDFPQTVAKNIQKIYGLSEPAAQALAPGYIRKALRYIFEVANLDKLTKAEAQNVSIPHERLQAALAAQRGVLIALMHAGNWELFGAAAVRQGYAMYATVKTPEKDQFAQYLNYTRQKNGIVYCNVEKENMYRFCLKAFRDNKPVMIAVDTGATDSDKNVELEFLGKKLPIANGWATLALKAKPVILPLFMTHNGKQHQAIFGDIIDPEKFTDELSLMQNVLTFFSAQVQAHPDEWLLALSESEVKKSFG